MDQYGYGGQRNPFDQRDDGDSGNYGRSAQGGYQSQTRRPPPQQSFGARPGGGAQPRYNQQSMGRDEYSYPARDHEMSQLAQNPGPIGRSGSGGNDGRAILDECRDINDGVAAVDRNLNQLELLQARSLNEADTAGGSTQRQVDAMAAETMAMYRSLTERVRLLKSRPESRQALYARQVGNVDNRLKEAIRRYQRMESDFRKKTTDQMARQYRIVRPDASESEVRAAVEDSGGQVFQQALMQSDRRGQARAVLSAVQDRHRELQKIEQQMIELAQLFQDMDTLVVQQEVAIAQIEQKGEEVVENLDKGNEEIAVAVTTARKTRKKKWICLGICVAIVLIVAIVVVVYIFINKNNSGNKKRDLPVETIVEMAGRYAPRSRIYGQSKIVIPGVDYNPDGDAGPAPLVRFTGGGRIPAHS